MDTAQWPQGIQILKPAAVENARPAGTNTEEKKPRPQKEQALNCPRCNSTNTKFCYYNNYSLSQPRYFCKTCRRYWTEGGSLRNVPVGGGSRKNKRSSSTTTSTTTTNDINSISSKKLISPQSFSPQNPKIQQGQDLNLAYNPYNGISEFNVSLPFVPNSSSSNSSHPIPVMELLKSTGNITSFISSETNSIPYNSSGLNFIPVHDFKPNLGFSLDGLENGYGNIQGVDQDHHHDTNSSRNFLFPFEELNRPVSSTNDHQFEQPQQGRGQGDQANGYWNGMLAGGSW